MIVDSVLDLSMRAYFPSGLEMSKADGSRHGRVGTEGLDAQVDNVTNS